MTAARRAPCGWSPDLCQADSGCRAGGARASSAQRLNLDGVRELLLHVGCMRDHQNLAEPSTQAGERAEQTVAVLTVERAEHLVEHEQSDGAAGEQVDLLSDGDTERQVGQVGLR